MDSCEATLAKEDIEDLLRASLGNDLRVTECYMKPLTKPGENYGSCIMAVEVTVFPGDKKISLVAKMVPVSSNLKELFNIGVTVRKEINFYCRVIKEYEKIQREHGLPEDRLQRLFPKCYGARAVRGKDLGQPADEGSLIILENLKSQGYRTGDRRVGLDLKHCELVVSQLARFHATAIAMKLQKPQVFAEEILQACVDANVGPNSTVKKELDAHLNNIRHVPGCAMYVSKVTYLFYRENMLKKGKMYRPHEEPFATIIHHDFWTNNMMFKYDETGVHPINMKMVDFQVTLYGSPAKDLLFFLHTSMQFGILERYYDELVRLYHNNFVKCLEELSCATGPFSFDSFKREIGKFAGDELFHIVGMTLFVAVEDHKVQDAREFNLNNVLSTFSHGEIYNKRILQILKSYDERGWL